MERLINILIIDEKESDRLALREILGGGGNILFGHADTNAAASTEANDIALNVTLIDNVVVEAIPEPASLGLLLLATPLALRRRRA